MFFDFVEAGDEAHEAFHVAEFLDHFHLVEEVGEVEAAFLHAFHGAHGVVFADFVGDLFDHSDDIAHAEDAVGHAFGVEFGELVEFFAFADEFDGFAGDGAHGECGAAAGVAVEFGEDDAGDADGVVEVLGDGDGLLSGGGVGDEECFLGFEEVVEAFEFGDEAFVDFLAAGGVEEEDGALLGFGPDEGFLGDFEDVGFAGGGGVAGDVDLFREGGELVDGGGAVEVAGDEEGAAAFFFEAACEFGGGGGFTGAVEAADEDSGGGIEVEG